MVDFVLWRIELRTINRLYKWLISIFVTTVSSWWSSLLLFFIESLNQYDDLLSGIYIYIYKRRSPTSIYSKLQLLCYFRFSGHKLVHLDLGGAPPKLTYLLQVIPFENHSALIYVYSRQNHLLYQILRFHLSFFFFAFAYFYIACHRSWFYLSFMAPLVFHIRLGWQMGKSLFANSSDQDIRSCMYIAAGDLPGFYSKESFLCQRLICGVQRKSS